MLLGLSDILNIKFTRERMAYLNVDCSSSNKMLQFSN